MYLMDTYWADSTGRRNASLEEVGDDRSVAGYVLISAGDMARFGTRPGSMVDEASYTNTSVESVATNAVRMPPSGIGPDAQRC